MRLAFDGTVFRANAIFIDVFASADGKRKANTLSQKDSDNANGSFRHAVSVLSQTYIVEPNVGAATVPALVAVIVKVVLAFAFTLEGVGLLGVKSGSGELTAAEFMQLVVTD